jgi:hypothetical protein
MGEAEGGQEPDLNKRGTDPALKGAKSRKKGDNGK